MKCYLKKEKDIIAYGHGLDLYSFDILKAGKISFGKVSKQYKKETKMGNGQIISGGLYYNPRTQKTSFPLFARNGKTLSQYRDEIIVNWIATDEKIFIYRQFDDASPLQRMEVKAELDSDEQYDNPNISGNLSLRLESEIPFYVGTEEETVSIITNSTVYNHIIPDLIAPTPFIIRITPQSTTSTIKISVKSNISITINTPIQANATVEIDTSTLEAKINGYRIALSIDGQTFEFLPGDNNLQIISEALLNVNLSFFRRYL